MYEYRKNSKRIRLYIPIDAELEKFIGFRILFEKGRKKSNKGLWRLKFQMEKKVLTKMTIAQGNTIVTDLSPDNQVTEEDQSQMPKFDFLCEGFLMLIKQFAEQSQNPI